MLIVIGRDRNTEVILLRSTNKLPSILKMTQSTPSSGLTQGRQSQDCFSHFPMLNVRNQGRQLLEIIIGKFFQGRYSLLLRRVHSTKLGMVEKVGFLNGTVFTLTKVYMLLRGL